VEAAVAEHHLQSTWLAQAEVEAEAEAPLLLLTTAEVAVEVEEALLAEEEADLPEAEEADLPEAEEADLLEVEAEALLLLLPLLLPPLPPLRLPNRLLPRPLDDLPLLLTMLRQKWTTWPPRPILKALMPSQKLPLKKNLSGLALCALRP
jgi:hypothetical protein